MSKTPLVLVTGGAGYIGSRLVPKLLAAGLRVRVLDAGYFVEKMTVELFGSNFEFVKGDIRNRQVVSSAMRGVKTVVHLAAVANDPSFSCDPVIARSINMDCLPHIISAAKKAGCQRFIYASSASVYGISELPVVDESHPCVPLTEYNIYKAQGESILFDLEGASFETIAVRAATVCGWSPRQRLDLTVNLLTAKALAHGEISVFGGGQFRPNIHIDDLARVYSLLVQCDSLGSARGAPLNAGRDNFTVADIALQVKAVVEQYCGRKIFINSVSSDDVRSYRLDSQRLQKVFDFKFVHTVQGAILELCDRWASGWFDNSMNVMTDKRYHNVLNMRQNDWRVRGDS